MIRLTGTDLAVGAPSLTRIIPSSNGADAAARRATLVALLWARCSVGFSKARSVVI